MSFIYYNINPHKRRVIDCTVRAISVIEHKSWLRIYYGLCSMGAKLYNMPSANEVWGQYLAAIGYRRGVLPYPCPECYTVKEFCAEHPIGRYILGTGSHVIGTTLGIQEMKYQYMYGRKDDKK